MKQLEFNKISTANISEVRKITERFEPYSDFNALSLLCWNANNDNSFAIHNDNLIIKIKDYIEVKHDVSVLGTNNINETVNLVFENTNKLAFVPEVTIKHLNNPESFQINEDRDSFDYIINTSKFNSLEGGNYKNLRRHVHSFTEDYADYNVKVLDLNENKSQILLTDLTQEWAINKKMTEKKIEEDIKSIKTFIDFSKYFKCFSIGLFVKEKLVAFTLNELLNNNWAMGHFGKSLHEYKESSTALEYFTSKLLTQMNYEYINIQQDTGIEGLRESKEALQPESYLKKYSIQLLR